MSGESKSPESIGGGAEMKEKTFEELFDEFREILKQMDAQLVEAAKLRKRAEGFATADVREAERAFHALRMQLYALREPLGKAWENKGKPGGDEFWHKYLGPFSV